MADLDALRTFIAAARLGSFAGAARQLNLSPAMVGRRIQGLEERYGLKLIERTTRSQHLTEQGGLFLARAEAVLDAAEALAECSSDTGALTGRIRLSPFPGVGSATISLIALNVSIMTCVLWFISMTTPTGSAPPFTFCRISLGDTRSPRAVLPGTALRNHRWSLRVFP